MLSILETLLEESFDVIPQIHGTRRQCQFPQAKEMIKVAIGMRRTGKSYFLYQTIQDLLKEGIDKKQILFINFEDERLLPMSTKQMGELLDAFYTLYPDNHHRVCYLFLDEVQNVPHWQQVVRRFFDTKKVQIYLTGSSAKLLSKEIATSLRGRSLSIEVWPFNFQEYLNAHQFNISTESMGKRTVDMLREQLLCYFERGGFPGVQTLNQHEWRDSLQSYVDTVILRDVIERHQVTNITLLKHLSNILLGSAACQFSVNKFYNDIKSQGYKVGKDTIYQYINYLEDAYLIFTVPVYTESSRIRQNKTKKIYAIDNGLIQANVLKLGKNLGRLFENQLYLDLKRQRKSIYYYHTAEGYEIDFVTIDPQGNRELIQAVWEMNDPTTITREKRALAQAEKELGIPGRIVTMRDYLADKL